MKIPYDVKRYEGFISQLETRVPVRGGLLLYGSSLLTNWGYDRSRAQLGAVRGLTVVNHGFGGATVDDALYYYHRLVRLYAPAAIVLRLGVNDVNAGLTADETFDLTLRVLTWLRLDFDRVPIAMISAFDYATCSEERRPHMSAYNALCARWASENENVAFLDLNEFVYEPGAGAYKGFRDIFVEDGLHLNDEGYALLSRWMKPRLARWLEEAGSIKAASSHDDEH